EHTVKKRIFAILLVIGLCVGTASAQFGFGIVYDPTNYANAVLRYSQLAQQLRQHGNVDQRHEHRKCECGQCRLPAGDGPAAPVQQPGTDRNGPGRTRPCEVAVRLRRTRRWCERHLNGDHRRDPLRRPEHRESDEQPQQDSLSNNPNLNPEVSVLNTITATNVLTLRTVQDSNKLLMS